MDSRLYDRRKELGLTLEEVGKLVGVSKSTVKKWETGFIENMKRDKIALLAKALKVSPLYIMGVDADPSLANDPEYINFYIDSNLSNSKSEDATISVKSTYESKENIRFIKKYYETLSQLNDLNKKKAIDYTENLLQIQQAEEEQQHLIPNAAHQRMDLSKNELSDKTRNKHDDDIMDDPNF